MDSAQIFEDLILRLQKSLSIDVFNELVRHLDRGTLRLTPGSAGQLVNLIKRYFTYKAQKGLPLSEKDCQMITCFAAVLQRDVEIIKLVDGLGTAEFQNLVPLNNFLTQRPLPNDYVKAGLELVSTLIESCPQYNNWKQFVGDSGWTSILEVVEPVASHLLPARTIPTAEELTDRFHDNMVKNFADKLQVTKGNGITRLKSQDLDTELFDQLATDKLEHLEDVLSQAEDVAVRYVNKCLSALRSLAVSGTLESIMRGRDDLNKAQKNLAKVHLTRRQRKLEKFLKKQEHLQQLQISNDEGQRQALENFMKSIGRQRRAIDLLDFLYTQVLSTAPFNNAADELCYLDRQINSLCDISISVAVSGLISVGKSTVVNCFTGANLSPNRLSTMTAIPTRYVHDPSSTFPTMILPFAHQLNKLNQLVRTMAREIGTSEFLSRFSSQTAKELIRWIISGNKFEPKYEGEADILLYSTYVHDLFRLAVDPQLQADLEHELPMDWSQGLDTYMTIYTKFPKAAILGGLITLSIVDTPGINEEGVKRLNLNRTIEASLQVCNYAALVTTNKDVEPQDLAELKQMLANIKEKWQTPMLAIITNCEDIKNVERETRKLNISQTIHVNDQPLFTPGQIHLVAARNMLIGVRMLAFLKSNRKKPSLNSDSAWERSIADTFIEFAAFGDNRKDKTDYYVDLSDDELKERSQNLIDGSRLSLTIDEMMEAAVGKGMEITRRNALIKAGDRIAEFRKNFSLVVTEKQLKEKQEQCRISASTIKAVVEMILGELDEIKQPVLKDLDANDDIITGFTTNLSQRPFNLGRQRMIGGSFEHLILKELDKLEDKKKNDASPLLTSTAPVSFKTQEAANTAMFDLVGVLKKAMEQVHYQACLQFVRVLERWTKIKSETLENEFARMRRLLIKPVEDKMNEVGFFELSHFLLAPIQPTGVIQVSDLVVRPNFFVKIYRSFKTLFSGNPTTEISLDPVQARLKLIEQMRLIQPQIKLILIAHVESRISALKKVFGPDVATRLNLVNAEVNDQILDTLLEQRRRQIPQQMDHNAILASIQETLRKVEMELTA